MSIVGPASAGAHVAAADDSMPKGRVVLASVVVSGVLCVLQTLAVFAGIERRGGDASFFGLLFNNSFYYVPWIVFSAILFTVVDRRRERLDARLAATLGLISLALFFVPYVFYEVSIENVRDIVSLQDLLTRVRNLPPIFLFVDFVLFVGCFATIFALGVVRGQIQKERSRRALEGQMLALRLELETQRLASIHAQLEPHFLFNALNAISALVRTEDRSTAVSALTRLSGLLRYALSANRLDRVTLREELDFVRDYLDLQRLRYGTRLEARIEVDDESLREIGCPPLLLQPLVENALRHDLDTHDGPSDFHLRITRDASGALVRISNPLREASAPNAGFGLGLGATRERLALLYGNSASLSISRVEGRFEVELLLPEGPDA